MRAEPPRRCQPDNLDANTSFTSKPAITCHVVILDLSVKNYLHSLTKSVLYFTISPTVQRFFLSFLSLDPKSAFV